MGFMGNCLEKDVTFEERFCYLLCIQVYASFRSSPITELLAFFNERWGRQNRTSSVYREWLRSMSREGERIADDPHCDIRLKVSTGALKSLLRGISEEEGSDTRGAICMICMEQISSFYLPLIDTGTYVDRSMSSLGFHDLVIYGIRV